jgi:pachytene checkpoint protein 2
MLRQGFSGRVLRKLPFQAHAYYLFGTDISVEKYFMALSMAIEREKKARNDMKINTVEM